MHIVASFEYSTTLELALLAIERKGIPKTRIVAIPLERRLKKPMLLDTMHHSDGKSFLDIASISGVIFMLLGAIYGFVLAWGPIIWGLIGLVAGMLFGYMIDVLHGRKSQVRKKKQFSQSTEVFVTVQCISKEEMVMVENLFWDHYALGVARLSKETPPRPLV